MVARRGFEPRFTESESVVLPVRRSGNSDWWKRWDSNPRARDHRTTRFPGGHLRPLGHSSEKACWCGPPDSNRHGRRPADFKSAASTIPPHPHDWWERRDSNPHDSGHRILNPARLPFRHVPVNLERMTGVEPATSTLGGWRSTAELHPHTWWGRRESNPHGLSTTRI